MPHLETPQLSRRERQIMDILFAEGPCSAKHVLSLIPEPPSYSSVRALLARLVEKGHARYELEDGRYIYSPIESQTKAQDSAISRLVNTFFRGSRSHAVAALLDMDESLSAVELDSIERKIQQLKASRQK